MDSPHRGTPRIPQQPRTSQEEYARSRHAVWLGAAALLSDELGRVLLVKPTYRGEWLLPGGCAEPGESPETACRREVHEELGLSRAPGKLLAVHWLSPGHPDVAAGLPFPGEVRYVLDGGVLTAADIASLRLPADELSGYRLIDPHAASELMTPVDARIVVAAVRARMSGATAHLSDGHHAGSVPSWDRHPSHERTQAALQSPDRPCADRVCADRPTPRAEGPAPGSGDGKPGKTGPATTVATSAAAAADTPGCPATSTAYGRSPVWLPPEEYAEKLLKSTSFACLFFTDERERPLQLRSVYSPGHPWQWPGGTMDPGERPWQTALRECQEETGIAFGGPPRLIASVFGGPGRAWPFSTIGFVFDGGRLTGQEIEDIALDADEHDEVRVLAVEEWRALMPRRDFARLEAVMEARRTGATAYFDSWDWDE
ncbi:NUDIX hydrolase [Streptomyces iconiensis]|uniref:NUDIX hydrolase n=1 Tax=Streptomyces iconiensis TaxID=1384038 RepID=A0ABT6ZSM9_9ACTN|nr:NUDIX hydrolase [Streptomyces iconiensis]MDJ1132067.1 NUDIX hydrolase [Streptomyces iconiensis]